MNHCSMKWMLLPLATLATLVLVSCHNSSTDSPPNLSAKPSTKATLNLPKVISRNKSFSFDTIKKESNYLVLGDSTELPGAENLLVALKFKPYIYFRDLPATLLNAVSRAPIQYSSNLLACQYRTVITGIYNKEGLNFGGHYCFAYWGCGATCQASVLIDLKTGIVYDGVDAGRGYSFRKTSRLLIANPPDSSDFYIAVAPRIYAWNETKKKFEQRE